MELKLPAYSYYYIYNTKNARKRLLFFQPRHRHQRMGSWHPHGSGSRSDTALVYRSFYISSHRYACFRGHPIVTETFQRYSIIPLYSRRITNSIIGLVVTSTLSACTWSVAPGAPPQYALYYRPSRWSSLPTLPAATRRSSTSCPSLLLLSHRLIVFGRRRVGDKV